VKQTVSDPLIEELPQAKQLVARAVARAPITCCIVFMIVLLSSDSNPESVLRALVCAGDIAKGQPIIKITCAHTT